ncbi:MAG TPA: hypothetical protein VGL66_03425 [Caulobacteraceae bacterium]
MTHDVANAREDLAFMRSLVEPDGRRAQAGAGRVFMAAGLIYGAQCLAQWAGFAGLVPAPLVLNLWVGLGPTVLCAAVILLMAVINRGVKQTSTQRALNAVFTSMGFANLSMVAVFAIVALQRHDWTIWELYACVVFAFQGAAWLASFALSKRMWRLAVALGWFATAVALSLLLGTADYILVAGLGLILFMALPGWAMVAAARREA